MSLLFKQKWPERVTLKIAGDPVDVAVRVHPRARSYRLSVPGTGRPVLTVPPHGSWAEAQGFLKRQRGWLEARLKRVPGIVPFTPGARIPVRGVPHALVSSPSPRGQVEVMTEGEISTLVVPGGEAHLSRRLTDWLKREAYGDLEVRVAVHAETLGVKATAIRLRGQTSRWGSCSSAGRLNFNWRLILAPPFVLDYVAAHEVAHLIEMNHSPAFWTQVEKALPDMARGRAWLKAHGQELMGYGVA